MSKFKDIRPKKSIERLCWIVTGDLDVCRVHATYDAKTTKWRYLTASKHKIGYHNLRPFYPTMGNGNGSYWGDGPHFKTKLAAKVEQNKLIKKEIKKIKVAAKIQLKKSIEDLIDKMRS